MSKRTIVTMPGDGIGKKVLEESLRVLDAVSPVSWSEFFLQGLVDV